MIPAMYVRGRARIHPPRPIASVVARAEATRAPPDSRTRFGREVDPLVSTVIPENGFAAFTFTMSDASLSRSTFHPFITSEGP